MTATELRYHKDLIGMEADVQPSMEGLISDLFYKLGDGLRNSWHALNDSGSFEKIDADRRRFMQVVGKYDYTDLVNVNIRIPEAMAIDYVTFLKNVLACTLHAKDVEAKMLQPLRGYLADLINQESARYTSNGKLEKTVQDYVSERERLHKDMLSCFGKKPQTQTNYGAVVRRTADWNEVFTLLKDIENATIKNAKPIKTSAENCALLIDQVVEMAKNKTFGEASRNVVKFASTFAYEAAEEVSFVATTFYHRETAMVAVSTSLKEVIKNLG